MGCMWIRIGLGLFGVFGSAIAKKKRQSFINS
jgi:hypothetical protein